MNYRSRSTAAADVFMPGPVGDQVLLAMGIAPAAHSIVAPEAMPAAMRALDAAIAHEASPPANAAGPVCGSNTR